MRRAGIIPSNDSKLSGCRAHWATQALQQQHFCCFHWGLHRFTGSISGILLRAFGFGHQGRSSVSPSCSSKLLEKFFCLSLSVARPCRRAAQGLALSVKDSLDQVCNALKHICQEKPVWQGPLCCPDLAGHGTSARSRFSQWDGSAMFWWFAGFI